jgi:hypothetical protein
MSAMMVMVFGNMVETEASWRMVVILAVAPVLVGIEATSGRSEASFGASLVEIVAMLFSELMHESIQIDLSLCLELTSKLDIHFIMFPHIGSSGQGLGSHQSSGSKNSREESH